MAATNIEFRFQKDLSKNSPFDVLNLKTPNVSKFFFNLFFSSDCGNPRLLESSSVSTYSGNSTYKLSPSLWTIKLSKSYEWNFIWCGKQHAIRVQVSSRSLGTLKIKFRPKEVRFGINFVAEVSHRALNRIVYKWTAHYVCWMSASPHNY